MNKFAIKVMFVLVFASLVLSACGGAAAKPEGEVAIVAWPGYIERGANDPAYDWVTSFEQETGCKVTVKDAATSDEMVSLMSTGEYDLVTASGDASLRMVYGEIVQEIDITKIPSYNTIDERLQNAPWHTVDGKHYGVSYQWGPNVLMYNTEAFGGNAPTSWSVVFEEQALPDGESNKDRVQAYSGPIYIADAALYLKAHNPELGITDPYELNEAQFNAALDLLRTQRGFTPKYWGDYLIQVEDFKSEGFVASSSWPLQVNLLQADGAPIASVVPEEGATGWADTTMMAANAPHPSCAYLWLEHSINPKVQGDVASWFGSAPSVPAACDGASELLGTEGCKANGYDTFDQIYFWKTPIAACGNGNTDCVTYDRWTEEFTAIVGQ
ncbi:MAG: ABC transporter substrate-binding protein [Anaerolineales bacterium]|nr:ABC transporter substrate-binding protein [Anaerolineales bacterium]MBK7451718.1 ABC transporter substrate-binding protein [Anaerolineales bacterium]MBK9781599.1 ABC transporter substrate-binding protein [Anaerolineales bacterium]